MTIDVTPVPHCSRHGRAPVFRHGRAGPGHLSRHRADVDGRVEPTSVRSNIPLPTGAVCTSWPGVAKPSTTLLAAPKTWMAATRTAMTRCDSRPVLHRVFDRSSTGQKWVEPGHDGVLGRRARRLS